MSIVSDRVEFNSEIRWTASISGGGQDSTSLDSSRKHILRTFTRLFEWKVPSLVVSISDISLQLTTMAIKGILKLSHHFIAKTLYVS
jgi:hypothetical protein